MHSKSNFEVLAPKPGLLLLDEPFSNLDIALRGSLSSEIREILKQLGISAPGWMKSWFSPGDKLKLLQNTELPWRVPWLSRRAGMRVQAR